MTPQVYLRKGKEESLMRRHPWIFSGAIDHIKAEDESEITEGALVEIYTRTGDFIALGHYQIGSIAVRVLTFDKEPIDQAWWNRRIAVAYDVRRTLGLTDNPDTDCYRLVHGEGDGLPGLVVDIYGTVAVVQCHSVGMYLALSLIHIYRSKTLDDIIVAVFRGIVDHGHLLLGQVDLHVLDALAERGDIVHDLLDTVFTVDVGRENRRHRLFVGSLLRCTHAHTHHECKAQH